MIIKNARLRSEKNLVDVTIADGVITAITPSTATPVQGRTAPGSDTPPSIQFGADEIDVAGRILSTPFAENHIHLDYADSEATSRPNQSGTLIEGITIWGERKKEGKHTVEFVQQAADHAVLRAVAQGYGAIRTHVDVTDPEMVGMKALLAVKEKYADIVDLQLIAFPQNSVYGYPNGLDLVEEALKMGADVVGGIPHTEPTRDLGVTSVAKLFDLAEKYGKPVDMHCDEIDDPGSRMVEAMARETSARGMQGMVTVAHAVAMAFYPRGFLDQLTPQMQRAELGFAIAPNENLHLQGRNYSTLVPRAVAPVKHLTEAGLSVGFCQDSIGDPWYPLGASDAVRLTESGLTVSHMLMPTYLDRALDFVSANPARNLQLDGWTIAVGEQANFVVLDAASEKDAVRFNAEVLYSIHRGKEVFRKQPATITWS